MHILYATVCEAIIIRGGTILENVSIDFYYDIPAPFAVFRVILNEDGTRVVDTEYVYVNDAYCSLSHCDRESLIGKSFLSVYDQSGTDSWFAYCYQAAVEKQIAKGFLFSPEIRHWLKFNAAPVKSMPGCCAFIFMNVDSFRNERDFMIRNWATEDFLISMAKMISVEGNYETMMNRMLDLISQAVHADRIYIMEYLNDAMSNTFEWCRDGVTHEKENLQDLDVSVFLPWEKMVENDSAAVIPDVRAWKPDAGTMYGLLEEQNIQSLLAIPIYYNGSLLGYLCADNYKLDEGLDAKRILETVATFAASKIANHRMMEKLNHMSSHDPLTDLPDRRGVRAAMQSYLRECPKERFSCVYMDIDDFKLLNDQLGHAAGDAALLQFAKNLQNFFHKNSIIGRLGGDEFMLILKNSESAETERRLQEFCRHPQEIQFDGQTYAFRVSVGFSQYPEDDTDLEKLVRKADDALYHSKLYGLQVTKWSRQFEDDTAELLMAPGNGSFSAEMNFSDLTVHQGRHRITGLPGLHHFFHAVYGLAAKDMQDGNFGQRCTVYFNVSNFKLYNEIHGIRRSDQMLLRIGKIIQNAFPDQLTAHIEADHFCVLAFSKDVVPRVEQVCEQVNMLFQNPLFKLKAGISTRDIRYDQVQNGTVPLDMAKIACDSVKHDELHNWAIYTSEMSRRFQYRNYILKNFENALQKNCISVYYQPIVRAVTGEICGYEALARWEDPKLGMLMPNIFIPTLEEANLIQHLDAYVIQCAARALRDRRKRNQPTVPISVNLSRVDFMTVEPFEIIEKIVKETGISRKDLRIEITETAMIRDRDAIIHGLKQFLNAGYSVSLDDFGIGYSSFGVLKDYVFRTIKIDRSFLLDFNDRSRKIIASVVSMAKSLDMHTLAEGVETEEQVSFLKNIGCEMIQGYIYGHPEPEERLTFRNLESPVHAEVWDRAGSMPFNPEFSIGICTAEDGQFRMLFANRDFKKVLKAIPFSAEDIECRRDRSRIDDALLLKFHRLFGSARKSGKLEDLIFTCKGGAFHLFTRYLAGSDTYRVYYLELYAITGTREVLPDQKN